MGVVVQEKLFLTLVNDGNQIIQKGILQWSFGNREERLGSTLSAIRKRGKI